MTGPKDPFAAPDEGDDDSRASERYGSWPPSGQSPQEPSGDRRDEPGSGQPGYGQPGYGSQPGYGGQPGSGSPGHGSPGYGDQQPGGFGPPPYGQQPFGTPPAGPPYGQPYGQQPYGQQPYGYPFGPPTGTNGMAIASLVCSFFCSPLGILFGFIAKRQIKETGQSGNGLATAGIVISVVSIVFSFLLLVNGPGVDTGSGF